jgi:hypothetical protein
MKPLYLVLLYFTLVLCYAAWKGNAQPIVSNTFFNSKGEVVRPVPVKGIDQVKALGSGLYYTHPDGQMMTDIVEQVNRSFNWEAFFRTASFGFGLAFLLLVVVRLSNRFAQEKRA